MEGMNVLEFRSIERFTTYDKVIVAGALAMAVGTFLPIIRLPFVGSINYIAGGHGDGMIILPLSGAIIAAVFYGYRRTAALVGFAALALMMRALLKMLDVFSNLRGETAGFAKDNPFGGLATALANSVGIEWGWAVLIGGALAVIGAGLISGGTSEKFEDNSFGPDQADGHGLRALSCDPGPSQEPVNAWAMLEKKIASGVEEAQQAPAPRSFGKRLHP
jgi:hypothetical protein